MRSTTLKTAVPAPVPQCDGEHGGHGECGRPHKPTCGVAQILRENIQVRADGHFSLETAVRRKFPNTLPSGVELARRQVRIRGVVQGVVSGHLWRGGWVWQATS